MDGWMQRIPTYQGRDNDDEKRIDEKLSIDPQTTEGEVSSF
jgi:hypothetical protein